MQTGHEAGGGWSGRIGGDAVPARDATVGVEQVVVAFILLFLTVAVFMEMDAAWKRVRQTMPPKVLRHSAFGVNGFTAGESARVGRVNPVKC